MCKNILEGTFMCATSFLVCARPTTRAQHRGNFGLDYDYTNILNNLGRWYGIGILFAEGVSTTSGFINQSLHPSIHPHIDQFIALRRLHNIHPYLQLIHSSVYPSRSSF